MSQPQLTGELEVPEGPQHPCQCSAIGTVEGIRPMQRERGERGVGTGRITGGQDHPRGLEALQRLESPLPSQEPQQIGLDNNGGGGNSNRPIDILEHPTSNPRSMEGQNAILSRHGHNLSCSPRNLDLSRNLAFEAARRVQESSALQDSQHSLTSSPSPLLEPSPGMLDASSIDLEKQLEEHAGTPQKQGGSGKEKLKNIQQVLTSYQHHHEPTSERNIHPHFHGETHAHVHKHVDNLRAPTSLDATDALMAFQQQQPQQQPLQQQQQQPSQQQLQLQQQQRQHTHHHHGSGKTVASMSHLHGGSTPVHHPHGSQPGHHHPNVHRNSPTGHGLGSRTGHHVASPGFPAVDHHASPVALSGSPSNPGLLNHGGSPAVHRHVVNANSNLSTTPLVSHHRVGSGGISCESSSSSAKTRAHSRLEHVHEHHHHLQPVHSLHPAGHPEPRTGRDRAPSSLEHHAHHHGHVVHGHGHSHPQSPETKNSSVIGVDPIQAVATPSKGKCQCHVAQQTGGSKRSGAEGESDGSVEVTSRTHQPPALPPRPPPRPTRRYEAASASQCQTGEGGCCKKYVILCCLCGGLSTTVGSLFLAVHAVLSAHTVSLALFETVPSYIPGVMLILMGLFTMLLARRKHRYGILMKVCGSVGVVCALVCVLVTVTTTVIHMSRLQGLRESCTCRGDPPSKGDAVLFEGTPHCEAVHGALYACLRALFGVSVAGILACIFSCMLIYQLLSHEKKKMYWEQLELRCRSLYGQGGGAGGAVGPVSGSCGCCNDCGAVGPGTGGPVTGASPWWAQTPGNLYTPNPDLAPSRRWRLPWSRSRGPAPSPDSNYGFHTQARQTEASAENTTGPYSVLNSQSSGPYSVLNAQTGPYTPSTASYSVLEAPVPLWGPPPPYSDPNSPARRPQPAEQRPRIAKRIENFESNEEHRPRSAKRPSDNYENAEEISNSTDPEGGNEGTMKGRRTRKPLKGVENGAFQQENNPGPKQSESELYFGDVSSCCGPESSFYDLAVEKEAGEHSEGVDYLAARLGKRQLSKRSRMPLPLPSDTGDLPSDSYTNGDEPRNARGPFLAPDAQYEVIQQARYPYYAKDEDELQLQLQLQLQDGPGATSDYFREEETERARERDYRDYRGDSQDEETGQCCLSDSTTLDSGWQSGEQQQSDDNVRPVNV